jgi:anti-sigma-K factor RskA
VNGLRSVALGVIVVVGACGSDAAAPAPADATMLNLTLVGLRALDATSEGTYEAWLTDGSGGFQPIGRFAGVSAVSLALPRPAHGAKEVWITVEPPGDTDAGPSSQRLLRGELHGRVADLSVVGAVTQGTLTLREHPGQFTMFSPSDNALDGYPSYEESGIWLFNMQPRQTEQGDMWVRLTQLASGWTYEGWMVRDIGQPNAIWLSYGKFLPDYTGAVNTRDDTGWGPYSGVVDFRTDGEEEFPGDDWISNPMGYPFPKELSLPLDLREKSPAGAPRWTHVITIEPVWNRGEAIGSERPFLLQPYSDPFGDAGPGIPRTITYRPENVPSGRAELR